MDLLTILPFLFLSGFIAFRILRIFRIFHLFRINTQYDSFNIITLVLKEKWKQIGSSLVIIVVIMLAASLGMYSVEHSAQPDKFTNAFSGMWWSVSALLTVGYGDIYPVTVVGKIMGILIAFLGVGVVAIPTGIISAGFVEQFRLRSNSDKKLAAKYNIPFIDCNAIAVNHYNSVGYNTAASYHMDDKRHYKEGGANVIAGLIANAIKAQGIAGLSGYVK